MSTDTFKHQRDTDWPIEFYPVTRKDAGCGCVRPNEPQKENDRDDYDLTA